MAATSKIKYKPAPDDVTISDLKIRGRRGPFWLRVLEFDEAFDVLFRQQPDSDAPLMLTVAAASLTNAGGPVYGVDKIEQMKIGTETENAVKN